MSIKIKKELGVFYTTQVATLLRGYEYLLKGKDVIDPMCGEGHLLSWAKEQGSNTTIGYDLQPIASTPPRDTILNPPDYTDKFILANPPYLLRNKSTDKTAFIKWAAQDLYKASILSFISSNASEGVLIIPANFWFDNDDSFREYVFSNWNIYGVRIYNKQMFPDTNVRVTTFAFSKGTTVSLLGHTLVNTRVGRDWQTRINTPVDHIKVGRVVKNTTKDITTINLHATDTGGVSMIRVRRGELFVGKNTDRNLATLTINISLTPHEVDRIIEEFNKELTFFRNKYNDMFLTNFLAGKDGVTRKRISFRDAYKLIAVITEEITCP